MKTEGAAGLLSQTKTSMGPLNASSPTLYPPNYAPPSSVSSSRGSGAYSPPLVHETPCARPNEILQSPKMESKKPAPPKALKPDFAIKPPSAPRSMRQAVSPPPIRRPDNLSGPSFRRSGDYDSYRPQEECSDNVIAHLGNRKISADRYKPSSIVHRRSVSPDARLRNERNTGGDNNRPGYDSYRPEASNRRPSQWQVPDVEDTARPPVPKNPTWRKPTSSKQQEMRLPKETFSTVPSTSKPFLASLIEGESPKTTKMPPIAPGQTSANHKQTLLNHDPLPTPPHHDPPGPIADVEACVPSIEKDLGTENVINGAHRSFLQETMPTTSLVSTTSTPSTAGTVGSKSPPKCRGCRKPASTVTPLVLCTKCRKGYHECCGDPSPRDR
jgi:hypothetical protein